MYAVGKMETPFDSFPRTIALLLVTLTGFGWLLVVTAFSIATLDDNQSIPVDGSNPSSYPFWMVSFCGPLIVTTALIHAAPWKSISSIMGAITSFLSVLLFTALGMLLYIYGEIIDELHMQDIKVPGYMALAFAGSLITTLFWTLLMVSWLFYDTSTSGDNVPFQGIARKITLLFVALTGVAWLLVVIGFGIGTNTTDEQPQFLIDHERKGSASFPYWVVCLSGPAVFVATVAHAALQKPKGSFVGVIMIFLNAFFLTGLGMILWLNGQNIRLSNDDDVNVPTFYLLEFVGTLLATLFWTPVMVLWHYYK